MTPRARDPPVVNVSPGTAKSGAQQSSLVVKVMVLEPDTPAVLCVTSGESLCASVSLSSEQSRGEDVSVMSTRC